MTKKILVPAIALAIGSSIALGGTYARAQSESTNYYPPIVQKVADKFGLNVNDVQKVFDQERAEHKSIMVNRLEGRLAQLVSEGKLTETQKNALLQKHKQLLEQKKAGLESLRNMTPEERKAKHEKMNAEWQAWTKENGIDPSILGGKFGPVMKFRHMM
jgi:hypothetical protein